VEADCYFLAAEALTRYLLRANNAGDELPGMLWSNTQPIHSLPVTDQAQLSYLLMEGIESLNQAVISPIIEFDRHRSIEYNGRHMHWTVRWSSFCGNSLLRPK
jgi:hypothetical protein